jgi:hypothetical protein
VNLQIALLGAPTSLASTMVIVPHHAAVTTSEIAPKWASGSPWSHGSWFVVRLAAGYSQKVLV